MTANAGRNPCPAKAASLPPTSSASSNKCGRHGRYNVARLIERLGADAKLTDWIAGITHDCPKRRSLDMSDQCGARCPDLPKVL